MELKKSQWMMVMLGVIGLLLVGTIVWASPPASPPAAPPQASPGLDADMVDGKHAVASWLSPAQRRYKLLWASGDGYIHWSAIPAWYLDGLYVNEGDDIGVAGLEWSFLTQKPATSSAWAYITGDTLTYPRSGYIAWNATCEVVYDDDQVPVTLGMGSSSSIILTYVRLQSDCFAPGTCIMPAALSWVTGPLSGSGSVTMNLYGKRSGAGTVYFNRCQLTGIFVPRHY